MKRVKLDLTEVAEQILNGFNDVDEFCLKSYECLAIYKEKMKKYHDQSIEMQEYTVGKLCTSIKLKATPLSKKLKSKLKAPFLITKVFPHGQDKLENKEREKFTAIGQRKKIYLGYVESVHEVVEAYHIMKSK